MNGDTTELRYVALREARDLTGAAASEIDAVDCEPVVHSARLKLASIEGILSMLMRDHIEGAGVDLEDIPF